MKQVVVGHDAEEPGRGWFLHQVIVCAVDGDSAGRVWRFPCDRYATFATGATYAVTFSKICIHQIYIKGVAWSHRMQ